MLYLYDILTPLLLGPYFGQFDLLVCRCLWDIRNRDIVIWQLAPRLVSHRDQITKLCDNGVEETLNSGLKSSEGNRRYAPGVAGIEVCIRPLEVKVEPTYENDREAVFIEFDDSYETRLGLTCSA